MPVRKKTTVAAPISLPTMIPSDLTDKKIADLETIRTQTTQELTKSIDKLIAEIHEIQALKRKIEEEQALRQRQVKQQEDEQITNLTLQLRKKQAEFDERLDKQNKQFAEQVAHKEKELDSRKEEWDKKKAEFDRLEKLVESHGQIVADAVDEAEKKLASQLKKDFETEKRLLIQKDEFEMRLLRQQIDLLEKRLNETQKEMISLKEDKTKAVEQLQHLAATVIKGKEALLPQQQNSHA